MPRRGAAVHELVGWLTGATRAGELVGLPPYTDMDTGPVSADDYARRLLAEFHAVGGADGVGMGLVEARGFRFRAWVETVAGPTSDVPDRGRSRLRRPDDPSGRGLNIGGALRTIAKNLENPPAEEHDHQPAAEESPESRGTRLGLILLFGVPLVAAVSLGLAGMAPVVVGWGLLALASLGLFALIGRIVPRESIREGGPDRDMPI